MPIHDLGYRNWDVASSTAANRWWVIAQTGVRQAMKSQWIRRMMFLAWFPAATMGGMFFLYEQGIHDPNFRQALRYFLNTLTMADRSFIGQLTTAPAEMRHEVWSFLMLSFFRTPQLVLMVLLVALVGPSLIAQDIRSRAFLIYFSRPLSPWEYVLGKAGVVWFFLICIMTLPALLLYLLGLLLAPPNTWVLAYTWDIPLRIVAASVVVIIPTSTLILCLSSLNSETRFAAYSWLSIWVMGMVSYLLLEGQNLVRFRIAYEPSQWSLISLYHTMGRVQTWIFGLESRFLSVLPSILWLLLITVVALSILLRRVTSPIRI